MPAARAPSPSTWPTGTAARRARCASSPSCRGSPTTSSSRSSRSCGSAAAPGPTENQGSGPSVSVENQGSGPSVSVENQGSGPSVSVRWPGAEERPHQGDRQEADGRDGEPVAVAVVDGVVGVVAAAVVPLREQVGDGDAE